MTLSTTSSRNKRTIKLWAVAFWLGVWQLGAMAIGQEILLVSPIAVLVRLRELVMTYDFWSRVAMSSMRIFGGLLIGMLAGTLLGALAAKYRVALNLFAPLVAVVRAIPVASFIIMAYIWISPKNLSVFIAFLICFPVYYTNVRDGLSAADTKLIEMARVFGLAKRRQYAYIFIPAAYPYFRSASGVAVGLAWKSGVAAELIAISEGSIGEKLYTAKAYLLSADMFSWTLAIVVLSALFEYVLALIIRAAGHRLEAG